METHEPTAPGERLHSHAPTPAVAPQSSASPGRRGLSWLRHILRDVPLVLLLASLTLILEHFHVFEFLEEPALTLIGRMPAPQRYQMPQELGEVVSLSTSQQMFESHFNFRLPVDRKALAAVLDRLIEAQPKLIAIDVDITPTEAAPRSPQAELDAPPIYQAVLKALAQGVDVVTSGYPSDPNNNSARHSHASAWRTWLCHKIEQQAATAAPSAQGHRGVFRMAEPWLSAQSEQAMVFEFLAPQLAFHKTDAAAAPTTPPPSTICMATLNEPLGLIASLSREELATAFSPHAETAHAGGASHSVKPRAELINFFGRTYAEIELAHLDEIGAQAELLKGRRVVLGVRSFEDMDQHATPLGRKPGSLVHAAIAATQVQSLKHHPAWAFGKDVLLGCLFLLFTAALSWTQRYIEVQCGAHSSQAYLGRLLLPLALLTLLVVCVLDNLRDMSYRGLWINPLVMCIGLSAHLYEHLANRHAHASVNGSGHPIGGASDAHAGPVDRWLRRAGQFLVLASMMSAAWILLTH